MLSPDPVTLKYLENKSATELCGSLTNHRIAFHHSLIMNQDFQSFDEQSLT